ncbi:MAG: hypothetical protein QOG15_1769 [Solirubrobacteraceae bacterium]|nr:hypothetical protein [Solirubrobacteraceae bacterium]
MTRRPGSTKPDSPPHAGATVLLAALALAAIAAAPAPAAAAAPPKSATFVLAPGGTGGAPHVRSTPGSGVRGSVLVRNVAPRTITVRLQPSDIRNATNGNADYVTTRLSGDGRWLHLAATTVRLAPHAVRRVAYKVNIPARARGASHYAGIVAVDAADLAAANRRRKTAKNKGFSFARINRQALPLTIRLPGPLTRSLKLRSVKLVVQPAGAGLVLRLRPGGTVLIQSAPVKLRVSRGSRTIFHHASTLGQLFPGDDLDFRIPWKGHPTKGSYHVRGVIRPQDAAPVYIDQTIGFSPAKVTALDHVAPTVARSAKPALPIWVWLALSIAAGLLIALSLAVWKLKRGPDVQVDDAHAA